MNNSKPKLNKKIRKGDRVIAIAGNYRGQAGTVLSRLGEKAIVQGLNIRKKHVKRSENNPKGGIVEVERPIHISNLRVCDADNKPLKLKIRESSKGERELYYTTDNKDVLYRSVKKQSTK